MGHCCTKRPIDMSDDESTEVDASPRESPDELVVVYEIEGKVASRDFRFVPKGGGSEGLMQAKNQQGRRFHNRSSVIPEAILGKLQLKKVEAEDNFVKVTLKKTDRKLENVKQYF